jgi:hypothetical protein
MSTKCISTQTVQPPVLRISTIQLAYDPPSKIDVTSDRAT